MYLPTARKSLSVLAVGILTGSLFANAVHADLFVSKNEIRRRSRVQWTNMKRHMPRAAPRVQQYVQCITYQIVGILPPKFRKLNWQVVVFANDKINAFAMPGGHVGVFTGLLKVADTPDALAAVLGHEIAHMTQHHVLKRAKREARSDALVILGRSAIGGLGGWIQEGAKLGLNLPFDRKQESEADLIGLKYMAEAGFDPRAALQLWKNMMDASQGSPPEILSNHPSNQHRLDGIVSDLVSSLIVYNKARAAGHDPSCHR